MWSVQSGNRQLLHALRQHPEQHTHRRPVTALDSLQEQEERRQQSSMPVAI
jgi:hypothetical protein